MSVLTNLKNSLGRINETVENIKRVTLGYLNEDVIDLDVNSTLSLLDEIEKIEEIDSNYHTLIFWGKSFRVSIEIYTEVDQWGDGEEEIYFSVITFKAPRKKNIFIPETFTKVYRDPKTRKNLPFKSKEYIKEEINKKEEFLKKEKEEYLNRKRILLEKRDLILNRETIEVAPLTTFKGGRYDLCRYIIMPDWAEVDKTKALPSRCLNGTQFKDMDIKLRYTVDFIGYAVIENGKLTPNSQVISKPNESGNKYALEYFNEFEKVTNYLIEKKKMVKIIGISPEILSSHFKNTEIDEVLELCVEELKRLGFDE